MKVGYQTLTWANYYNDYDIREVIKKVKEIGFKGIELIEPISKLGKPDSLKKILEETGLEAASISCGLNMKPEDTSDIEETNQRVKFASQLGIRDMMLCGGWLSDSIKKEDSAYRILADKLDACCEYASGLNMNIAFHPLNTLLSYTRIRHAAFWPE